MNDSRRIVDALKRVVRTRGWTYRELAKRVRMSESSVKRLFSLGSFSLAQLVRFCDALEIDFAELARLAQNRDSPAELTMNQEIALAADVRLLALFYLVINGWTYNEIISRRRITAAQCVGYLTALDRLRLIELLPNNRVRLLVPRSLRLKASGPIRTRHGKRALDDFLAPQFDREGGYFAFEFRELSRESFEILKRKLGEIANEMHELAELDTGLASNVRQTIGVAVGIRPWSMEQAIALPARNASAKR